MLLKKIPGVLPVLENSDLSASKLWNKSIARIVPEQLTALILQTLSEHPDSEIELEVKFAIKQIKDAHDQGLIPETKLLSYTTPEKSVITMSKFIRGLHKMTFIQRRAVLFGLEMNLPMSLVENLTYGQMRRLPNMTHMAKEIAETTVLSIHAAWAFWDNYENRHTKLTNLEEHVYEAFGMTSYQLNKRYGNFVYDYEAI